MKKPKVLFLNPAISPYRIGFYKKLSKLINVKFLFYFKDAPEAKGLNYEILKGEYNFIGYNRGFNPELISKLFTEDYDIVVNSDPCSFAAHVAYPIVKLRKKKFITWAELWHYPNTTSAKIIKPYVKQVIKSSDVCIVAGTKAKELMEKFGAKKIMIAPNASFDITKLKSYKINLPKRFILQVGAIRKTDGIKELIKAFQKANLKGVDLVFVGPEREYVYAQECRQLAKGYPIHFVEYIPWRYIKPYYEKCLFCIHNGVPIKGVDPVHSWEMSLNEAISASKPIVATDIVGGAFDLIDESKNGYIIQAGNIVYLTKILKVMCSSNLKKMGKHSRKIYKQKHNHDFMAKKFVEAIFK